MLAATSSAPDVAQDTWAGAWAKSERKRGEGLEGKMRQMREASGESGGWRGVGAGRVGERRVEKTVEM